MFPRYSDRFNLHIKKLYLKTNSKIIYTIMNGPSILIKSKQYSLNQEIRLNNIYSFYVLCNMPMKRKLMRSQLSPYDSIKLNFVLNKPPGLITSD